MDTWIRMPLPVLSASRLIFSGSLLPYGHEIRNRSDRYDEGALSGTGCTRAVVDQKRPERPFDFRTDEAEPKPHNLFISGSSQMDRPLQNADSVSSTPTCTLSVRGKASLGPLSGNKTSRIPPAHRPVPDILRCVRPNCRRAGHRPEE